MSRVESRIVRRETHSPRTVAAASVAIVLVVALAWLAVEGILHLLGMRPLLLSPRAQLTALAAAPSAGTPLLVAVAAIAGVVGVVLVALAVLPGRRPRRVLLGERAVVVADDEMLASALARRASRAAAVSPDAVTVSLGRRTGVVRIAPVSGMRVNRDEVRNAVADEFDRAHSTGPMRFSILVSPTGKVGS